MARNNFNAWMLKLIEEEEDDDYGILLGMAVIEGEQLAIESRGPRRGGSMSGHVVIIRNRVEATIRMLAFRASSNSVDDYVGIGESTTIKSLKKFVKAIIAIFGEEYLRSPNSDDVTRLLAIGEKRGFSGMLGSVDCVHWKWKNYPSARAVIWYISIMGNLCQDNFNSVRKQEKLFANAQETSQKDVERAFEVLQARFAIVCGPARF
ncbi:hypothetical protein Dsin_001283 [Dipteronia sinensis]|uniref:Nuclease HARBI1 n=1 Tax=Dipteronia sinensis TaxID=43782 RepID=A0AAE0EIV0_9ROSI|nr:hypothetical protein Dsin_001283 [Dipteronia sinensis]